jgi:hypothetical protein
MSSTKFSSFDVLMASLVFDTMIAAENASAKGSASE